MVYLLGTTDVEDFDQWRSNFAANDAFRREHGQRGYQIFRSQDDPDEAVVLFEWDDRKNAQDLFDSEEMRVRLADAGVKAPPALTFLDQVDAGA